MHNLRDIFTVVCISAWAFIAIRALLSRSRRNPTGLPYPPGPRPKLLVGNLFDVPKERPYLQYAKWSKKYNRTHIVVVNSAKAAKALFDQRSSIYSDRPYLEMFLLTGWDFNVGFMRYSDAWRAHRRVIHQWFRQDAVPSYHPLLISRIRLLLHKVLEQPDNGVELFRRFAGAFSLKILYGRDVDSRHDPLIDTTEAAMSIMGQIMFPGASIVNTFPFLSRLPEWVPGMKWTWIIARKCKALTSEMQYGPFLDVKKRMNTEDSPESKSILANMLRQNEREGKGEYGEWVIRQSAATLNAGAADSSMSTIAGAILALVLHPHTQARGQDELDIIIGRDRLPNLSDREQLPYVSAICKEVLRWKNVAPLAMSHACTKDDVYEGMFIPRGSVVTGNTWAILHDPEFYPDPDSFLPERFITKDGTLIDDELVPAFGFGRRVCPGRYFAYDALWQSVASILSVFNIEKAKNEHKNEIEVNPEYDDAGISHPLPFECVMRPRDEKAVALIKSQANKPADYGQL